MNNKKQTCILVLGMHRSGTSALTGVLSLLDVYLGSELMEANFANEKGYFENNILYKINEKLLGQINSSWNDTFYDEEKLENISGLNELKIALKSEFKYANTFAIKDPRLAYLFPIYKKVLKKLRIDIKIILPYRNPLEVANSLKKRDAMPLEKGMLLWAYHFLMAEKFSRGFERVFVNFDELIVNASDVIDTISSKLALDFVDKFNQNKKEIEAFLEPSLKHHNISIENLSNNTPHIVKEVLALKDSFNIENLDNVFDVLREGLFSYQKLFYNSSILNSLSEGEVAKHNLQIKIQELNQTTHNLQAKEQELNQTTHNLHLKEQELNQTVQNLQTKEQELTQTQHNLHLKEQELNQTVQNLQVKEQELNQATQNLQTKEQELNQVTHNFHLKEQELNQVTQNLQTKEQELNQATQNLQTKEQELNQTAQNLQVKEQELNQTVLSLGEISSMVKSVGTTKGRCVREWGQIGVRIKALVRGYMIGPPAAKE
ncbi:MAG: hypothetical protein KU28_07440 [Sulfurovum sp. PC08-66]|nr:MAG: hypothetical protein KU28_07440 [Sulfurovum sp. PC08-66]